MTTEKIKKIEYLSARALPCLERIKCDGWELRFAPGHTRRANSVNVVTKSQKDVDDKIKHCESIYTEHGQACHFRITPLATADNLDSKLAKRGYDAFDPTDIRLLDLSKTDYETSSDVLISNTVTAVWLSAIAQLTYQSEREAIAFAKMLSEVAGTKICASILKNENIIACGYGVAEEGYLGLFEIATDPALQRKGYAKKLLQSILQAGKTANAKIAYLQVIHANKSGNRFWDHLGFEPPLYSYHYRSKAE